MTSWVKILRTSELPHMLRKFVIVYEDRAKTSKNSREGIVYLWKIFERPTVKCFPLIGDIQKVSVFRIPHGFGFSKDIYRRPGRMLSWILRREPKL